MRDQTKTSEAPVDEALLSAIHDAFNSRDVDRIVSFFADDGVFSTAQGAHPYGEKYVGKENIKKFLAARFARISDMSWKHLYRYACGDRAVSYWVVTGTSESGEKLEYNGCDLYDFNEDGKIVYKDTFWKIVQK